MAARTHFGCLINSEWRKHRSSAYSATCGLNLTEPGETLKERIERGALAVDEAVDIATQVGQGLAKAS